MRFSLFNKVAGFAAAAMVLPVLIACEPQTADTADSVDTEVVAEDSETVTEAETTDGETIVDVAAANGSFNTLVAAIEAAELTDTLSGEGPLTVFAPTDEAFEALPEGVLASLLEPENQETLASILQYHVVSGEVLAADVTTGTVASVGGPDLNLVAEDDVVTVNDVMVSTADVAASNGVIHVIDMVLLPPDLDLSAL